MSASYIRFAERQESPEREAPESISVWLGFASGRSVLMYILLTSLLASGVMIVKTTHENRLALNELQLLREEANQLDVEWGQLLLEQSTFGLDGRIEDKASRELQMQVPQISDIIVVSLHDQEP